MDNFNFGQALGLSSLGSLFGSLNSFNRSEYNNKAAWAFDPLGSLLGYGLVSDDSYQDSRSRAMMDYQAELNSALMAKQYNLQMQGLREGPTAYKAGLLAAGYNPMLAVTNGMPAVSVGSQSVGSQAPSPSAKSTPIDIAATAHALASARQVKVATDIAARQSEADLTLKGAQALKTLREAESISSVVEQENRKYGNGLIGEVMRFVRALKEGVGFVDSSIDSRLGDLLPSSPSLSSAYQSKVISDEEHKAEKRRGDAVRARRARH